MKIKYEDGNLVIYYNEKILVAKVAIKEEDYKVMKVEFEQIYKLGFSNGELAGLKRAKKLITKN